MYPAIVESVDRKRRVVKVKIPGFTDGATDLPEAEMMYGMGDRPENSEIEILPGDKVWVDFIFGNMNYPIITGRRNPETDNVQKLRKWHHENIELNADENIEIIAGKNINVPAGSNITISAGDKLNQDAGSSAVFESPEITLKGDNLTLDFSKITVKGQSLFQDEANFLNKASFFVPIGIVGLTSPTPVSRSMRASPIGYTGTATVDISLIYNGGHITYKNTTIVHEGGTVTHDGKPIDKRHVHKENGQGEDTDTPS